MKVFTMRAIPLLVGMFLFCQCGAPQPPRCITVPLASRQPAPSLIADAQMQWQILGNTSRRADWEKAQASYNASVAKLFDQLRCGSGDWNTRALALGTSLALPNEFQLDLNVVDAVFPASLVKTERVLKKHEETQGIGLPLVGWKKTTPIGTPRAPYLLPNGYPFLLTATLEFDAVGKPTWHFIKRWVHNDLKIKNTKHLLAADWSAPNAFFWKMCALDNLKIQNVLLPSRFIEETGIYFLQPYDPKKIPIVFVHGLVSSPDAFKNMINEIAPEPWFRERYQIWLYNYPTGGAWIFNSTKFRELMSEACAYARTKGDDQNLNRMVVVAHSMGGLLTRSSISDPKQVMYDAYFDKPIDQLQVSPEALKFIRDSTLYQPLKEPKRVVFLAVPHRGSPLANQWFSNMISRVIRLPKTLTVTLLDKTVSTMNALIRGNGESKMVPPTAINSLSPTGRANVALNKIPLPDDVIFHSVIGDRGKGNTPHSSDGVVPYWSSHVDSVASELIVPCNHSVPTSPQSVEELKRILKLHLLPH